VRPYVRYFFSITYVQYAYVILPYVAVRWPHYMTKINYV